MKNIIFHLMVLVFIAYGNIKAQSIVSDTKNTIQWNATLLKTNGVHFVDQQENIKYYIQVKNHEVISAYAIDLSGKRYDGLENVDGDSVKSKKKKTDHTVPGFYVCVNLPDGTKKCKLFFMTQ